MNARFRKVVGSALCAVLLASCSSLSGLHQQPAIPDDVLLAEDAFPVPDGSALRSASDIFAISPEMGRFLDENVPRYSGIISFAALIEAMNDFGIRYLDYDNDTLTAAEAFEQRRGNCLTFTNLFLVMARESGLKAWFQEVRIPPDWARRGELIELRRHVNVRVRLGVRSVDGKDERVVDFGDESIPAGFIDLKNRVISDQRALAHFYNNWAVETLEAGDAPRAFAYVRKALREGDANFAPAWNLVGVLHQRAGQEHHAEQSYLRALQVEPGEESAMSNLERLYTHQGRTAEAERYAHLVERHRLQNPYYRFAQAQKAYRDADYEEAVRQLRAAVRLKNDEGEFYRLLGDVYATLGETQKAAEFHAGAAQLDALVAAGHPVAGERRLVKPKALSR